MRLPFNHYPGTSTLKALGGLPEYHGAISQAALIEFVEMVESAQEKRPAKIIPLILTKSRQP